MSTSELPAIDPRVGLAFTAADLLIPIFINAAKGDAGLAKQMALVGIEDYQPTTRADYVNLARTIALSMASLDLLGHAASSDMTLPQKMQALGRANALNRSADQSERTMMQRRRHQQANRQAEQPDVAAAPAEPASDPDFSDTDLQASVTAAMKDYLASGTQAATAPQTVPAVAPAASGTNEPWPPRAEHQTDPVVAAAGTAIQAGKTPDAAPSYRTQLLRNSAMQRGVAANGGLDTRDHRLIKA
jgi:hypothetical protein